MKNLFIVLLLCVTFTTNAQTDYKQSIQIGTSFYNPITSTIKNLGNTNKSQSTLFLRFNSFFGSDNQWNLGITTGILSASTLQLDGADSYALDFLGISGIANVNYHWYRDDKGTFYSGAGLGFLTGSINSSDFFDYNSSDVFGAAYQITLIGVQAKVYKALGIYSELGFGTEGVFQTGLQFRW